MRGLLLAAAALLATAPAQAKLLLTQRQALALAFPEGTAVERRTVFLTEAQRRRVQELARAKVDSIIWTYYVGRSTAGTAGYAYFETHVVRTMPETFMAVLDEAGDVRFVELLSFQEPDDYRPGPRWLGQFRSRSLDEDLLVHRAIRNMTGATLTSHALADGMRRVMALHRVLHP